MSFQFIFKDANSNSIILDINNNMKANIIIDLLELDNIDETQTNKTIWKEISNNLPNNNNTNMSSYERCCYIINIEDCNNIREKWYKVGERFVKTDYEKDYLIDIMYSSF